MNKKILSYSLINRNNVLYYKNSTSNSPLNNNFLNNINLNNSNYKYKTNKNSPNHKNNNNNNNNIENLFRNKIIKLKKIIIQIKILVEIFYQFQILLLINHIKI